ncbi:uncharacterized protein LOC127261888 [Andrographis paniculata]|uniref:uncharacterized protein LOC127261888 n=1 Tax=Andrographis paniculata TaxID=175694 RepID=UPI0021E75A89|nr:uncharacterized protein LOC127261888 [Andrographis paniculata]XP_051146275.1 uncharacterized protein LOC127261888 [Andrographis paniculata]
MEFGSSKKSKLNERSSTSRNEDVGERNDQGPVEVPSPLTPVDSNICVRPVNINSSATFPTQPELVGPAAIDAERPIGVKKAKAANKPKNQRQRQIQQHEESQGSIARSITASLMKIDSASNERWSKFEEEDRRRDLQREEEYGVISERSKTEHSIKINKEYANIAIEVANISERLMEAEAKLEELDKDNLDTFFKDRQYEMQKEQVQHYTRALTRLRATLQSIDETSPTRADVPNISGRHCANRKRLFSNTSESECSLEK